MQLRRARFLSTASTIHQGASGMWVRSQHRPPWPWCTPPSGRRRLEVHRAELPLLQRIVDADEEAQLLLLVGDREPVLDEPDARAHQHALELRARAEELLVPLLAAEAHHPLDAGAVVPAAVEQHDLAGGGQVRHVALEVPLRALALVGRRQRHHAATRGFSRWVMRLITPPLPAASRPSNRITTLWPVCTTQSLQLDQLALQAEQLAEIAPTQCALFGRGGPQSGLGVVLPVLVLELQFLVETVDQVEVQPFVEVGRRRAFRSAGV